jgi:hypothetical protein
MRAAIPANQTRLQSAALKQSQERPVTRPHLRVEGRVAQADLCPGLKSPIRC